jgi:tetratricopeptide (TPR) repeat protein
MEAASPLVGYAARAFVIGLRGSAASASGRFDEGLGSVGEGIAIARAAGSIEVVGWLLSLQANIYVRTGEMTRAADAARECMEIAEKVDSSLSRALACNSLCRVLGRSGDLDAGLRFAQEAVEYTQATVRPILGEALSELAQLQCAKGAVAEARETAARALHVAEEGGFGLGRLEAEVTMARISLADAGETSLAEAGRFLDRAERTVEETGCLVTLPEVFELRAQLARRREDDAGAAAALREAQRLYREMGAPLQVELLEKEIDA